MSINGMDSKEMEAELAKAQEGEGEAALPEHCSETETDKRTSEIEPFDTKLAQRIQALSQQIENHTLQLANLRRTAPAETSHRFQESFSKASEEDVARVQKFADETLEDAKNTNMEVGEVERLDEIQASWQNGSENLLALKSGMGGTVAKMERARQAVDVLEGR